jgi:hypothetical protein
MSVYVHWGLIDTAGLFDEVADWYSTVADLLPRDGYSASVDDAVKAQKDGYEFIMVYLPTIGTQYWQVIVCTGDGPVSKVKSELSTFKQYVDGIKSL